MLIDPEINLGNVIVAALTLIATWIGVNNKRSITKGRKEIQNLSDSSEPKLDSISHAVNDTAVPEISTLREKVDEIHHATVEEDAHT